MLVVISIVMIIVIYILIPTFSCILDFSQLLPDYISTYLDLMNFQFCYQKSEFIALLSIIGIFTGSFIAKDFSKYFGVSFSKTINNFISSTYFYLKKGNYELKEVAFKLFWLEYIYKFLRILSGTVNYDLLSSKNYLNRFLDPFIVYVFSPSQILQIGAFLMFFLIGTQISNLLYSESEFKLKKLFRIFLNYKSFFYISILFIITGAWERYLNISLPLILPLFFSYISRIKIYRPYFTWKQFYLIIKLILPTVIILLIFNPWFVVTRLNQSYTLRKMIEKKEEVNFKSSLDLIFGGDLEKLKENSEGNNHGKELNTVRATDDKTGFVVTLPGDIYISSFKYPELLVFLTFTFIGLILVLFENYILNTPNIINLAFWGYILKSLPTGLQTQFFLFFLTLFNVSVFFYVFRIICRLNWDKKLN